MVTAESEVASLDEIGGSLPNSYTGKLKPSRLQSVRAWEAPAQGVRGTPLLLLQAGKGLFSTQVL